MASTVSLGVEAGVPVVRQRAEGADAERLRHTAARLAAAAHPGVVRIVVSRAVEDGWELVTEHGGLAVGSAQVATVAAVTRLGSVVATTLADLHERGVVHGRLDATRILLGPDGRPVVCGLAPAGEPGSAEPTSADDVGALAAVLDHLLAAIEPSGGAERARADGLRTALERAHAEPATRRPSARRLAAELAALSARPVVAGATRARPRAVVLAGIAIVLLVVGLIVTRRAAAPIRAQPSRAAVAAAPAAPTTSTGPPPSCVAMAGRPLAADPCGHDVVIEGPVVVLDGRRYVVGLDGDEVAVGDWRCEGQPRAAVLRPSTGEVRVFAPFTADRALEVATAERVPGARSLRVRDADGCPTLGVLDPAEGEGP